MTPLIDFHSHSIKNIDHKYLMIKELGQKDQSNYYVAGVHPWDLQSCISEDTFNPYLKDDLFLGIGEIGLDKLRPNFDLQLIRFDQQVKIAIKLNINFLVIHNVRSSQEIIRTLKGNKYSGFINLHGFNSSLDNFKQFSAHFKTIISVGDQYLKSNKLQAVLNDIKLDHIFFESDDSDLDILNIYKEYALQNNINLKDLTERLNDNFTKLIKTLNIQH
jgi:TatD DNase family protein